MTKEIDVQAYLAISAVKARYCRMLDTKDWDAFTDLFTEDLDMDSTPAGGWHIQGREAAIRAVRTSLDDAQTTHQVHSPEMEINGDVAHVIWAMQDRIVWNAARRPRPDMGGLTGYGHYHERYVRKDGQWRIAAQRLTRLIMDVHAPAANT
jgi:ketosteroid isomerase-like protein